MTSVIFDSDMFPVYNLIMVAENMVESGNVLRADPGLFDWGGWLLLDQSMHTPPSAPSLAFTNTNPLMNRKTHALTLKLTKI